MSLQVATSWPRVEKASASGAKGLYAMADRLSPKLRKRFLAAIRGVAATVDLDALAAAFAGRQFDRLDDILNLRDIPKSLASSAATIIECFQRGGLLSADALAAALKIGPLVFDLKNPRAVAWAKQSSAALVTEISTSAREALRTLTAQGLAHGIAPVETARLMRASIGLTDRQAMAVMNYRFALLEQGRTPEDVARLAERYSAQLLNYRARVIARNETLTAAHMGQQQAWQQATDQGLLNPDQTRRRWSVAMDDRTCPICLPMHGQEVAFSGEPFLTGDGEPVDLPPAHVMCRCAVGLVIDA